MKTAEEIIREILEQHTAKFIEHGSMYFRELEIQLLAAFGWHPIDRADAFDLRTAPRGHRFGPRIIAMVQGDNEKAQAPYVVYWDPDTHQPNGRPVAHPSPYWRTVGMTADWSRRNQPTHFIRPYAPSFDR